MQSSAFSSMAKEFGRIILPTDGSDEAKKAMEKAIFLASHLDINVVAMFVVDMSHLSRFPVEIMPSSIYEFLQKEALSCLNEVEKMGKRMGVKVTKKIVEGIPYEEIVREARKNDLIVMGNKGMTALDRIFLGSVAEKVVRHAPCTVMICK